MAVSTEGTYVAMADALSALVEIYDFRRRALVGQCHESRFPRGLCFTPQNTLLICDGEAKRVLETSLSGDVLRRIPTKGYCMTVTVHNHDIFVTFGPATCFDYEDEDITISRHDSSVIVYHHDGCRQIIAFRSPEKLAYSKGLGLLIKSFEGLVYLCRDRWLSKAAFIRSLI